MDVQEVQLPLTAPPIFDEASLLVRRHKPPGDGWHGCDATRAVVLCSTRLASQRSILEPPAILGTTVDKMTPVTEQPSKDLNGFAHRIAPVPALDCMVRLFESLHDKLMPSKSRRPHGVQVGQ